MTRIAVFADTHGDLARLDAAMEHAAAVDAFIHLGDHGSDACRIADRLRVPYHAVRGNCDYSGGFPAENVLQFEKAALFITHGHQYTDVYALLNRAEELHCAAALFGHTHRPLLSSGGHILAINPGSLSRPRFGSKPSFCLLDIQGDDIQVRMISL